MASHRKMAGYFCIKILSDAVVYLLHDEGIFYSLFELSPFGCCEGEAYVMHGGVHDEAFDIIGE